MRRLGTCKNVGLCLRVLRKPHLGLLLRFANRIPFPVR